jgi:hypothetical protein
MKKCDGLTRWLERQTSNRVELPFEDIEDEDKIGVQLPKSAKQHQAWWANDVNPKTRNFHCRLWTDAGWRVEAVNLRKEVVIFVRNRN